MSTSSALSAYIQAILPEREAFLREQAMKKARPLTRGMSPDEAAAYYDSKAFSSAVYRAMRADKAWQALRRGELALDYHQEEFQRLQPLIEGELRAGNPVNLPFLRSVDKSRAGLKRAREALKLLREGAPRRCLSDQIAPLTEAACEAVRHYLLEMDFSSHRAGEGPSAARRVQASALPRGISADIVRRAMAPKSPQNELNQALRRALPRLNGCGVIVTPSGRTVSVELSREVDRASGDICAKVKKRFPADRVRKLLSQNPSVRRLQKQLDAAAAREKKLKSALISAIPEHYRDLYPLARQMRRRFILHLGPTNSGKTHDGVGRLRGARRGIYLGPLRLLAAEQFETLNLNDVPCSLVTGEEQIRVPGSRVQSSTVEMADLKTHYDVAVIDECQMIADRDRGGAWTAAILGLCADEIHACASPDAEELLTRIIRDCGDELTIVRHHRMTPLEVEKEGFQFPESVRRGDALIVFSKARVHAVAAELKRLGHRVCLIYGALPPDVRRDQAVRFQQGDADVVVSTDAIAMGMNLPIQRVVFLESEKYDGDITRPLFDSEIKQIAGRAGRYGQYDVGYVNAFGFRGMVAQALERPLLKLTEAIISFPESLLGLPLPLTQIIDQWLAIKDRECFTKASAARMAALAAMMETRNTDKALLYRFLCMPFDETDPDLLERWRAMYRAACAHETVDVIAHLPPFINPDDCTTPMLDGLEEDYRRCDLYYNYARLFLDEPDGVLEEIQRRKYLISQGIIHILSTQRLQQRTCPKCGRALAWNWPYRQCDACYRQHK